MKKLSKLETIADKAYFQNSLTNTISKGLETFFISSREEKWKVMKLGLSPFSNECEILIAPQTSSNNWET